MFFQWQIFVGGSWMVGQIGDFGWGKELFLAGHGLLLDDWRISIIHTLARPVHQGGGNKLG